MHLSSQTMASPEKPLDVLAGLFGSRIADALRLEADEFGSGAPERLARAADQASWWGDNAKLGQFMAIYLPLIDKLCSSSNRPAVAKSWCLESLRLAWIRAGRTPQARPLPQPFGEGPNESWMPYEAYVTDLAQNAADVQWRSKTARALARLSTLFDKDFVDGERIAAEEFGEGADARLARAAQQASWWGRSELLPRFLVDYQAVIASRCSSSSHPGDAISFCNESLQLVWQKVGTGAKPRPTPQPFGSGLPYEAYVGRHAGRAVSRVARSQKTKTQQLFVGDEPIAFAAASVQEDDSEKWALRMLLMDEVQRLPAGQRNVMLVRLAELADSGKRLSSERLGQVLGKSSAAIDMAYFHALKTLTKRLGGEKAPDQEGRK